MRYAITALAALPFVLGMPTDSASAKLADSPKYIVVLKSSVPGSVVQVAEDINAAVAGGIARTHTYEQGAFKGFAASLSPQQLNTVKADPRVAYVEPNGIMTIKDQQNADWWPTPKAPAAPKKRTSLTQTGAPWGLGRISHREKGSAEYLYDESAGEGTCSYVVDTGVNQNHVEFEGRATFVANLATGSNATTDDNGHGTHCSGTIGSKAYGVAKKTKIYAIKVLDSQGSGTYADVIAGINMAVTDSKQRSCPKGVVVNMSLGGGFSQSVNDAVAAAVDAGLFFGVAAGNEGQDYHNSSPASEPKAFAVGASDINDKIASFSNYGKDLGIFAPGVNILSTWIGSNTATNTISGTSMATPHTVGLAAYILGLSGAMKPADLRVKLQGLATTSAITGIKDSSPNLLAYNGISPDGNKPAPSPTPAPTPAPIPAPTWPSWPVFQLPDWWPFGSTPKKEPAKTPKSCRDE